MKEVMSKTFTGYGVFRDGELGEFYKVLSHARKVKKLYEKAFLGEKIEIKPITILKANKDIR